MLSSRLIHMIEEHWESITEQAISQIRRDRNLAHLIKLPDAELRDTGQEILRNLGHWLEFRNEVHLAGRYEGQGRLRYKEWVPLAESVRGLQILKETTVNFVRNQGFGRNTVEIYAQEELEHRTDAFFDYLIYHLVHGYEEALREAAHATI